MEFLKLTTDKSWEFFNRSKSRTCKPLFCLHQGSYSLHISLSLAGLSIILFSICSLSVSVNVDYYILLTKPSKPKSKI